MIKVYIKKNFVSLTFIFILGLFYSAMTVSIAILLENAVNIAVEKNLSRFVNLMIFTLCYIVIITIVFALYRLMINKFICKFINQVRSNIFISIIQKNHEHFNENNVANYISVLSNDIQLLEENYVIPLITIWQNCCLFILTFALLLRYNYLITLWLIFLLAVMLIYPNIIGRIMQKRQKKYSDALSELINCLKEFLSGHETIFSFNVIDIFIGKFESFNHRVTKNRYKRDKLMVANDSISSLLASCLQISILFLGGFLVISGEITLGVLIALMQLCGLFTTPLTSILQNYSKIKSSKPILDKLNEFVVSKVCGKSDISSIQSIYLDKLTFRYPNNANNILTNINYRFDIGSKYLIIGKSGSGKSTLVKLIAGYYKDYGGQILYDNYELRCLTHETISKMVSIIHQEVYMFNASVRDNITLYRNIATADLQCICSLSGVDLFLNQLESGLDTIIGENGKLLSGGQRQRIAIARALVQGKAVLVLDEGTSSLDRETAKDIEQQILAIPDVTVLTISHNTSNEMISEYDQILMVENEEIIEIKNEL